MDRFVPIGEVVKAVGLRGEVKLYPLLDFYGPLLDSGFLIWQDGTRAGIVSYRASGSTLVLMPAHAAGRSDAENLIGRTLGFDRDRYLDAGFPRPEQGLPFRWLERMVETTDGEIVGEVVEVRFTGSNYLLVIEGVGKEILIPAVEPILRHDPGLTGNLVIDPPEGLLDVQSG